MMKTQTAAQPSSVTSTLGAQLRASPAVNAAIDTIIKEVRSASSRLTDIRPPNPGLKVSYDQLLKQIEGVRGRGLFYPYISSGLGNGALIELGDGSVKWDMICGIGVHFFGHSDAELIQESLTASLDDTLKHGQLQSGVDAYEFAGVLLEQARKASRLENIFISTSGAMANENALKICFQKHAPASRVLVFKDCFMGRSTTMAQLGDAAEYRQGMPLNSLVDYMPFYDPVAAKQMGHAKFIDAGVAKLREYIYRYPGQHACFVFEFVQGEGGFNEGNRDYFKALIDVCREHRIAIWDDEIQTFGRLPKMFAYEFYNLGEFVDVLCVGKMTQACATLWTKEYNPKAGLLSGTFSGEGVSFRVGRRILERLRDGGYYGDNGLIAKHAQAFHAQAQALAKKHPQWFPPVEQLPAVHGGVGGMMRLTPFGGRKDKVVAACHACFDEGLVLFYCGHSPYHIRMLPPLGVMKLEDWPKVFAALERGLARVAGS